MKLNLDRLHTIGITLQAIDDLEKTIEWYSDTTKVGPVYVSVKSPSNSSVNSVEIQFDRADYIAFAQARIQHLIDHLKDRFEGFEYDPKAHWTGDHVESTS